MVLGKKLFGAAAKSGRALARYRGLPFADHAGQCAKAFQQGLDNVNFDMVQNGELRVLEIIAGMKPKCLFDVGANVGEWSQLASRLCPDAHIHAFEVVPSTFAELQSNTSALPAVCANPFGLSDAPGEITIHLGSGGSTDATACKIEGLASHDQLYVKEVRGEVRTGAHYLAKLGIDSIDFLKIDVEGMDLRVIKGFGDGIRKVRALQFEYGIFNISSHDLLADFCNHLTSHGFLVGKVFPRTVQFFEYDFAMENFHGSNFVAVRDDEPRLKAALLNRASNEPNALYPRHANWSGLSNDAE